MYVFFEEVPFDSRKLTCAHRTLPGGTRLKVTNLENGRCVEVFVTDRGPFDCSRVIDLSYAAARAIGSVDAGVVPVRIQLMTPDGRSLAPSSGPQVNRDPCGPERNENVIRWASRLAGGGGQSTTKSIGTILNPPTSTSSVIPRSTPRPSGGRSGTYTVQLGAYRPEDRIYAEALLARVASKTRLERSDFWLRETLPGDNYVYVRYGAFDSADRAQSMVALFTSAGIESFVSRNN